MGEIIEKEEDLKNLIKNQIEENTNLEYKDPRALNNNREIAKDISAMANSNGGIIIYGLCEENKDHKPTKIDWIENHQQKERIEQILQANVTSKIDLQIKTIQSMKDSSNFVLVVNVPRSDIAPHQDHSDKDKRIYWRRNGYTTREMEHYEIEDLFFKRKRPILEIKLERNPRAPPSYNINIINNGKVLGEKIMIQLLFPAVFRISDKDWEKKPDIFSPRDVSPPGAQYSRYVYFQDKYPVFPGVPYNSGIIYCSISERELQRVSIGFLITCKDMELKRGIVTFEENESITDFTDKEEIPFPPWPTHI